MKKLQKTSMRKPNDVLLPEVRKMISEGHTVTLKVRGNSMRPFLESSRDYVLLAPFDDVSVGDVVLAEVSKGRFVLHRVIRRSGDDLVLKGDGNPFQTEACRVADVAAMARGFHRRNKFYPTDGRCWRAYSSFWMNTMCMRRWFLAAYRRMPIFHK